MSDTVPTSQKGKSAGKPKVKRIEVLSTKVHLCVCFGLFPNVEMYLQRLVPGMLILGAVLEIHEYVAVLSLPFNMRGTVAISDISDHVTKLVESEAQRLDASQDEDDEEDVSFSEPDLSTASIIIATLQDSGASASKVPLMERLFSVGQLLPCYVLAVHNSRINLSINPRLVNEHLTTKDLKPKLVG